MKKNKIEEEKDRRKRRKANGGRRVISWRSKKEERERGGLGWNRVCVEGEDRGCREMRDIRKIIIKR